MHAQPCNTLGANNRKPLHDYFILDGWEAGARQGKRAHDKHEMIPKREVDRETRAAVK